MKGIFASDGALAGKKRGDMLRPEELDAALVYLKRKKVAWDLHWTDSVALQREDLDLVIGDFYHVLREGTCVHAGATSSNPELHKYLIVSKAPADLGSVLGLVIIPDFWAFSGNPAIKICELLTVDGVKRYLGETMGTVRENPVHW
ncbi:MAG: hypothetical protein JJ878_05870 [Alphaproteobacteria bacterium]|nr:hypothetical protein [Alphaproteobacteria bacterium]